MQAKEGQLQNSDRLLGHAGDLNTEANAALQALLLVSAM